MITLAQIKALIKSAEYPPYPMSAQHTAAIHAANAAIEAYASAHGMSVNDVIAKAKAS